MYGQIIAVALACLLAGCSLRSEAPIEDVDKAAGLFYQRLGDADYDAIYKDTAEGFKQKKTRQEIMTSLMELTANGKVVQYARISTTTQGEGKDRILGAVYGTTFEKVAGNLTLYFIDESGEWRLIGFELKKRG